MRRDWATRLSNNSNARNELELHSLGGKEPLQIFLEEERQLCRNHEQKARHDVSSCAILELIILKPGQLE